MYRPRYLKVYKYAAVFSPDDPIGQTCRSRDERGLAYKPMRGNLVACTERRIDMKISKYRMQLASGEVAR